MKDKEKTYWRAQIATCQKYMEPKHRVWRRLLRKYELEMQLRGVEDKDTVRISRFYPLVRQITAATSFNYPKMALTVEDAPYERASLVLERAANRAINLMNTRDEVHQVIFDTLFCAVGWVKFGYNPPGDDSVAPYVASDGWEEDFPYVQRVDPFNIFVDPLTPPHKLAHARYIIERMVVPLEFVQSDKRYQNRRQIQAISQEPGPDDINLDIGEKTANSEEEALGQARAEGGMTVLYEVHDRIHRRRITFANGVDEPIEDIEHPMARTEPVYAIDPYTGEQRVVEWQGAPGYLVEGGFPYGACKFDTMSQGFYPHPPLEYVEDAQEAQCESMTRRRDLLQRFKRIILGSNAEKANSPTLGDTVRDAKDAEIVWVNDVRAFAPIDWGSLPDDQLQYQADARIQEEEMLHVSEFSSSNRRMTATQSALIASSAGVNQEWMQAKVAELYRVITTNVLNIMGDSRYTPDSFVVNTAPDGQDELLETLQAAHFLVSFRVTISAGSMQPLVEQLERDDTLQLYRELINAPEVNRNELLKMVIAAFRVPDPDKLLTGQEEADTYKAAQLENVGWLQEGADPGVLPEENHEGHLRQHGEFLQQMTQTQQQLAGQLPTPQSQQQLLQVQQAIVVTQQHMEAHQQALAQSAQTLGGGPVGQAPAAPDTILGQIKSNAQKTANAVKADVEDQAEAPGR